MGTRAPSCGNPNRQWVDLTATALNCPTCVVAPTSDRRFELVYHIARTPLGSPLWNTHRGNFWLVWQPLNLVDGARVFVSGWLRSTLPPDPNLRFATASGYFGNPWTPIRAGVSLYSDLTLGAMKGLWIWDPDGSDPEVLRFAPTADGSLDGEVGDANDWRVMERGICKMGAIRPDSLCGQIGSWGF